MAAQAGRGGEQLQEIGYNCRIRPNSRINGAWIETDRHTALTNNDKYAQWLEDEVLRPALVTNPKRGGGSRTSTNGACDYDLARARLDRAAQKLQDGEVFPRGGERRAAWAVM